MTTKNTRIRTDCRPTGRRSDLRYLRGAAGLPAGFREAGFGVPGAGFFAAGFFTAGFFAVAFFGAAFCAADFFPGCLAVPADRLDEVDRPDVARALFVQDGRLRSVTVSLPSRLLRSGPAPR